MLVEEHRVVELQQVVEEPLHLHQVQELQTQVVAAVLQALQAALALMAVLVLS